MSSRTLFRCVSSALLLLVLCGDQALGGTTITQWNFNSNPPDLSPSTGSLVPSIGSGTVTVVGGTTTTFASGDANGGSTDSTSVDDSAYGVTSFAVQGTQDKMRGIEVAVSTVGFAGISVSWDQRHSNTSSRDVQFQYSLDGTNFIDSTLFDGPAGDTWFNNRAVNLSSITGANDNPNFKLRVVAALNVGVYRPASTSYAVAGTWRFDMMTVSAASTLQPGVTISKTAVNVSEAGATETYTVALNTTPDSSVDITLTPSNSQIALNGGMAGAPLVLQFTTQTAQTVIVSADNDAVGEGPHVSVIAHSISEPATDYPTGPLNGQDTSANITDDDVLTLNVVNSSLLENSSTTATVTRGGGNTTGDLTVTLSSSDNAQLTVPASATILDGQTSSPLFALTPVNDALQDGNSSITLTASAANYGSGTAIIVVQDDDSSSMLTKIGGVQLGGAEISAYDKLSKRLFVVDGTSSLRIVDLTNPAAPALVGSVDLAPFTANSVDIFNGIVAVAAEASPKTDAGKVFFINAANGVALKDVLVGALPDMIVFTPDGTRALTANEGEPNSYGQIGSIDPEGSVSVVDISAGVANATVTTLGFTAFNVGGPRHGELPSGVRISGLGATVAQDLEPEYIAISPDGTKAWVTLQENNAIAILNLGATPSIASIVGLGYKDYSLPGNGFDGSDRDGPSDAPRINIANWPVRGLYMPDGIAAYSVGGQNYIVTANEGDARDYTGHVDESRLSSRTLDAALPASLKTNAEIGRLNIINTMGKTETDADSEYEQLYSFGARSFTIRNASGGVVFDSGDQFEQITAAAYPSNFNASHDNANLDDRSDNKGPEPEGVVVADINGRKIAFIVLERISGVMAYDVTNPAAPRFIQYINTRNFSNGTGDRGPEGIRFIKAADSPTGKPLLVVANELSFTIAIYQINVSRIYEIQGTGHTSPVVGASVSGIPGIVTAARPSGDANGDGTTSATQDQFVELVNAGSGALDISGWKLYSGSSETLRHTFAASTSVAAGASVVVFSGGTPTGIPGIVATAGASPLTLSSSGDTVTVRDISGVLIATYTYLSNQANSDQSLTRLPDITGEFAKHGAAGFRWSSPGLRADGSAFPAGGSSSGTLVINEIHADPNFDRSFWMQDMAGDADTSTSDALYVFISSSGNPGVAAGDSVLISGTVLEFQPGGVNGHGLSLTEISTTAANVLKISSGNTLPAALVVGTGGRIPPSKVIDNDSLSSTPGGVGTVNYDPAEDGIDFWETLEGMRIRINNARVTAPTNNFYETYVAGDNGASATGKTSRGGLIVTPGADRRNDDLNPELLQLDACPPALNTGAKLSCAEGVLDYNFGKFELRATSSLYQDIISNGLAKETTGLTGQESNKLRVAGMNVENLDAADAGVRFTQVAEMIVNRLDSPDVIALQEIQDNNGATNNGVVAADQTATLLINAISAAGGPAYTYTDIVPVDGMDGGEPGGNIRVAYLYNAARVTLVDCGGKGSSTEAASVTNTAGVPGLNKNPARINPANTAWNSSRKPLVGEFLFNGVRVFIINNHFTSKGGGTPLFGDTHPYINGGETQRNDQATQVKAFVDSILAVSPNAAVMVAGDLNEFDFYQSLKTLEGNPQVLFNTNTILPLNERYSYVFEGNSQELDHLYVTARLRNRASAEFDIVHANSEFWDQISDHDPSISRFTLQNAAPVASNQSITATEDLLFNGLLAGTDSDGDVLTFSMATTTSNGNVTLTNMKTGAFTYKPNANYNGPDSFTFKVHDGTVLSVAGTVNIFVNEVNDAPVPVNDAFSVVEDSENNTLNILANDTDLESNGLTITSVKQPANGTVLLQNNTVTYTPDSNFTGTDTFTYTISDGSPGIQTVTVPRTQMMVHNNGTSDITVFDGGLGSALAPVPGTPNEFYLMTDRGPNVDGVIVGIDKIFPNAAFTPRIVRVRVNTDGTSTIVQSIPLKNEVGGPLNGLPNPGNATGETAFQLEATPPGTITLVNPNASVDGFDPEGLVAMADGTFWFSDEYGPFIVHLDAAGKIIERLSPNPATRKLPLVLKKRRANRGMEGLCVTPDGTKLVGMMQSALYNPSSAAVGNSTPVLRIVTFTIASGAVAEYLYLLEDVATHGGAVSEIAAISNTEFLVLERDGAFPTVSSQSKKLFRISLANATNVNDPADSAVGLLNGSSKTIEEVCNNKSKAEAAVLLKNFTHAQSPNGISTVSKTLEIDLHTYRSQYQHDKPEGLAVINGGATIVISNDDDFGVTSKSAANNTEIAAKINPASNAVDTNELLFINRAATVTVTVTPVNDAPVALNGALTTDEDKAGTGTLAASDPENTALTFSVVAQGAKGTAVITGTSFTYTPVTNANGTDTFTFKANDGNLNSNTATLIVTINPVNDAPTATDGALMTNEDTSGTGTLSASDLEGNALTFSLIANGAKGTALISNTATGAFSYTPNKNATGADTFTFKANDGSVDSTAATITVTINSINDLPIAVISGSSGITVLTGTSLAFNGSASSDSDGTIATFTWNFGDGSTDTASGAKPTHAFASAGIYIVSLTVTDNSGGKSSAVTTSITVAAGGGGSTTSTDTDSDGFTDELEIALNTDPNSASSSPLNNKPLEQISSLTVSKKSVTLNLKKPASDSITLSGALPVPAGFNGSGQKVILDVGGVIEIFTLDAKGKSTGSKNDIMTLQVKTVKGQVSAQDAALTVTLKKGDFAAKLADEGFAVSQKASGLERSLVINIIFNGKFYEKVEQYSVTSTGTIVKAK